MTKRALIVAIDDFQYQPDLIGQVNTANRWKTYFLSKGFAVYTLYDGQATKSNINIKLNSIGLATQAADTFVFVYIGHGGQVIDINNDEIDHLDECITPYDTTLYGVNILSDDEIATQLSKCNASAIVECIFDCCHSGTMADQNITPRFTCWAACRSDQLSSTGSFPDGTFAIFSYVLQYYMAEYPLISRQDLLNIVEAQILSWGPTWHQNAQLECTAAKRAGIIFTA